MKSARLVGFGMSIVCVTAGCDDEEAGPGGSERSSPDASVSDDGRRSSDRDAAVRPGDPRSPGSSTGSTPSTEPVGEPSALPSAVNEPSSNDQKHRDGGVPSPGSEAVPDGAAVPAPEPTASNATGIDAGAPTKDAASAAEPEPEPEPEPQPAVIAILGSSSVAGKNLDQPQYGGEENLDNTWANRYTRFLTTSRPGSSVILLAKAGYDTWQGLPTGTSVPSGMPSPDPNLNVSKAISFAPHALIVHYPSTRDLNQDVQISTIVANLVTIADEAATIGAETWVMGPNPNTDQTQQSLDAKLAFRAALSAEFGAHFIDNWAVVTLSDGSADPDLILLDGAHPNAEGHRVIFELVRDTGIPDALLGN